ncbi:hypothetical protein [Phenylobacterium soli]|nr:hypothetical protein [Phenylobacterium soli]
MAEDDILTETVIGKGRPSPWAVAGFLASCAFTGGALLLLILSLR